MRVQRILVPIDFTSRSLPGLLYALELARVHRAEVTLLHSLPAPALARVRVDAYLDRPLPRVPESAVLDADERLEQLLSSVAHHDLIVHRSVEVGDAAATIVRIAVEGGFDLIVIATHGRHGLRRLLAGSVVEALVSAAPCPMVVVPPCNRA
jgi:nucleotide-binding universal stress UspA family protein